MNAVERRAEVEVREKQSSLLQVHVSVGRCRDCPLYGACSASNDADHTCRLTTRAVADFVSQALLCPWILPEDYAGVRALAAIHASMALAEEYFRVFGSVTVKKHGKKVRTMEFKTLHTQYTRLQEKLQAGLEKYGLTPTGRRLLKTSDRRSFSRSNPLRSVEDYVDARYSMEDLGEILDRNGNVIRAPAHALQTEEPSREGEHSGVLPRPAAPEPASPGDSGGHPQSDLQSPGVEVPA